MLNFNHFFELFDNIMKQTTKSMQKVTYVLHSKDEKQIVNIEVEDEALAKSLKNEFLKSKGVEVDMLVKVVDGNLNVHFYDEASYQKASKVHEKQKYEAQIRNLEQQIKQAVKIEDYEAAAKLKKQLNELKDKN